MRNNVHATENDMAQFAVKAWLEGDRLEVALNKHTCAIERAFLFLAREYIFKCVKICIKLCRGPVSNYILSSTRMCISYEFQRYIPLVTAYVFISVFQHELIKLTFFLCRSVSGLFHRNKAEEWRKSKFCTIRTPINISF